MEECKNCKVPKLLKMVLYAKNNAINVNHAATTLCAVMNAGKNQQS